LAPADANDNSIHRCLASHFWTIETTSDATTTILHPLPSPLAVLIFLLLSIFLSIFPTTDGKPAKMGRKQIDPMDREKREQEFL